MGLPNGPNVRDFGGKLQKLLRFSLRLPAKRFQFFAGAAGQQGPNDRKEAAGMLLGEYNYSIDGKGRLNFPAKFRDEMGEKFVVTRWLDKCLIAFPMPKFEEVAKNFIQKGMVKGRDIQRFLFSAAEEVTLDKQGRILLSAVLRQHAGLDKDVTIIGSCEWAEIWDTAAWEAYSAEKFDANNIDIAAAMEEMQL